MLKTLKSRLGFTLLELVTAIAISVVVLAVLLPLFLNTGRIYRDITDANLLQAKSVHAIDFIKLSIQDASELRITTDAEPLPDNYSMLWCKDNKLYYSIGGSRTQIYMPDTDFELSFWGDGNRLEISLQIVMDGDRHMLESVVALQNTMSISGETGNAVVFKTIQNID